jgi:L-amino acid N-acyltransferase YncA
MPPKSLIRLATHADLAAINDIYNYYVLHFTCTYQEVPSSLDDRRRWFDAHGPSHPIIVAEIDGRVGGFGSLSPFRERSAFRFTVENALYVAHDLMGRGIGGAMLADLIGRGGQLGHRAIVAVIDAEQAGSIRIHERHGFVRCAHFKEVGFKFGRWLDVICLELLLQSS